MKRRTSLFVLLASLGGYAVVACSSSSSSSGAGSPAPAPDGGSAADAGGVSPIDSGVDASTPADAATADSGATTTIAAARSGNVTTPVTVLAVVTALHGAPGDYSLWYIEDSAGGPNSGVEVYCDKDTGCGLPEPSLNDLILITGALSTYHGVVQLVPTAKALVQSNAARPPIPTLTMADLAEGAVSPYRGVLVKYDATKLTVDDVTPAALYDAKCNTGADAGADAGDDAGSPLCTSCAPPTYSGFQVNDGQGHEVYIENAFFTTDHLQSSPECTTQTGAIPVHVGMTFSTLTGILEYDSYANAQQISPVADSDYTTP